MVFMMNLAFWSNLRSRHYASFCSVLSGPGLVLFTVICNVHGNFFAKLFARQKKNN